MEDAGVSPEDELGGMHRHGGIHDDAVHFCSGGCLRERQGPAGKALLQCWGLNRRQQALAEDRPRAGACAP